MPRSLAALPVALAAASLVLLSPRAARAGNEAAAEALFVEAQKLVKEKKYAEACPKFAESNRLDRGAGTLIHLANCYEKNKQTASAWATYKEAASAAQALGRADWQKLATQRAKALEPKLAKLTIRVPEPVDKLTVTNDGAPLSEASWGVALPVDTGSHAIEASAPDHDAFTTTVTVAKDGETLDVVVPKLNAQPKPVAETKPEEAPPARADAGTDEGDGSGQRAVGFLVGGLGVAGIAVGAVTGLMAIGKNSEAKEKCPSEGACASPEGVEANDAAKSLGLVSTIAFGAGAALAIGGAVLVFTAPKGAGKESARVRVTPTASASGGGLLLGGSF